MVYSPEDPYRTVLIVAISLCPLLPNPPPRLVLLRLIWVLRLVISPNPCFLSLDTLMFALQLFVKLPGCGSYWNFFALLNSILEDHQGFEKWHNGGGSFHSTACVDETAVIEIGAVVHPKAVIGPNTYIGSGAIIGPAVSVGQSTKLGYNVALSNCTIGDYCVIHNGVCIGQDGFGFFLDEHGGHGEEASSQ
ncbi:trimeric LpxA-like enzymes superfamily protein [Actinidia rufa]|uniref:Trimeric LpxA-like enzymes superfamily protein n=1 Tax=Actinidia rufa TaxID=165716 RepID=A0A7J0D8R6_9ERIC|nr:trimeric LpxA-like enzymes superfamily protein [Actinidia rufa]